MWHFYWIRKEVSEDSTKKLQGEAKKQRIPKTCDPTKEFWLKFWTAVINDYFVIPIFPIFEQDYLYGISNI
jgi:hypothetical protein